MKTMTTVHKTLFGAVVMSLACMFAFNANASDRDYRERDRGNYNPGVNHVDNNRNTHYDNNRNNNYDSNRNNHYEGNRNNYGSYGNNGGSGFFNGWFGNSNRFSFNGGFWGGVSQRNWVEGYYETVCTKVLVSAAHTERRWIEPTYQTGYYGGQQRCVREGYWQDVFVPARYEDRQTRVWHPGCYRSY